MPKAIILILLLVGCSSTPEHNTELDYETGILARTTILCAEHLQVNQLADMLKFVRSGEIKSQQDYDMGYDSVTSVDFTLCQTYHRLLSAALKAKSAE